jgi:hypothetical protein
MRRGTLLALGGLGALTHSIIWHQIETDSPPVRPLPVFGAVPEPAAADTPDFVVRSCTVGDGEVTIDAVVTNNRDEMRWFRGIDYQLLDANGDVVEGIGAHDPFESPPLQVGAHRTIHVVDSNPAHARAVECVPTGIIDIRPYTSPPHGVPTDVRLSGCVDADAVATARNPSTEFVAIDVVVEYFDADGFSLGRISHHDTPREIRVDGVTAGIEGGVEAGATAAVAVAFEPRLTVGGTVLTASGVPAGCEVVAASYDVDPEAVVAERAADN